MNSEFLNFDKLTLAYIIGVALGDGNLSNPNGRAVRLRVTCDTRYPAIIKKICASIQKLLPNNKVSIVHRSKTFCDISCYSNKWGVLLGWHSEKGSKYKQKVSVPEWIKGDHDFSLECLKGLLETDGSIYLDRGYTMVNFVTIIPTLAKDVVEIINSLGFKARLYKIDSVVKKTRYNIRLSSEVAKFLAITQFVKN